MDNLAQLATKSRIDGAAELGIAVAQATFRRRSGSDNPKESSKSRSQNPSGQGKQFEALGAVIVSPINFYKLMKRGDAALLFPGGAREALHGAVLFDAELAAEMLLVSSERCRNSNRMINLLLDGIDDASRGDANALARICHTLRQGPDSMEKAAEQLEHLLTVAAPQRLES